MNESETFEMNFATNTEEIAKRIALAASCALMGCLIGGFLFPGAATAIAEQCSAK
jgi:hypothetical protein